MAFRVPDRSMLPTALLGAFLGALLLAAGLDPAGAQMDSPSTPRVHALVGARIVVSPGRVIDRGTVVIRDGVIVDVGAGITPPADARIWKADSLTVYAGLIDPYLVPPQPGQGAGDTPWSRGGRRPAGAAMAPAAPEPDRGTGDANSRIHPEESATDALPLDHDLLEARRAAGFTLGNVVPARGILRGVSVLAALGDNDPRASVFRNETAQVAALETSGFNSSDYPASLMGSMALIRQTLSDAQWYRAARADYDAHKPHALRPEQDDALDALQPVISGERPILFATDDNLNMLRAAELLGEFGLTGMLAGSGHEYERLEAMKSLGLPLLLPVDFPAPPKLKEPADERATDTADLRFWALAPGNPAAVDQSGITWAFTADGLKDVKEFRAKVREAIGRGLSPDRALAACTTVPARLLGVADRLGTVEAGKAAFLVVTDGDLFAEKSRVREVWVDGDRYEVKEPGAGDLASGSAGRNPGGERSAGRGAQAGADSSRAAAAPSAARDGSPPAGGSLSAAEASKRAAAEVLPPGLMGDPDAWHAVEPPQPAVLLVRNATLWTGGAPGRLEHADLLVKAGKVAAVGPNLAVPSGALVIDAAGKEVTSGLIDCHSHAAISGDVNEGTHNVTAEVRIGDVVNSETINIYRELAGGLTVADLLHGSANAIGGQNQVIKLRWGALPEALKLAGSPPGIKFALGENPKQSNWGDQANGRYPQTRMGVEQLIRERFLAARDYARSFADFAAGKGPRPRRDYQLDALSEVLAGTRLIHCHSYRQDEILMLMRLTGQFGIHVGTFQHVLEGYKVADEIAAHGAGASTFSDWWAFKFEVYDAIPYNGALMRDRGVTVSFNSDSSELARRLNYEAAKAIKYSGCPNEEALKFVTWNPARQLGIDRMVGSLEPGKDADFVIWSGDPLSTLSICEQTWIDGRRYFDRAEDLANRPKLEAERTALIAWARKVKEGGGGGAASAGWSARQHPGYLDEDGTDKGCHDDGTDRHQAVLEAGRAGR